MEEFQVDYYALLFVGLFSCHAHDAPSCFSALDNGNSVVDVVQSVSMCNLLIQLQSSSAVEFNVTGNVYVGVRVAAVGAQELSAEVQRKGIDGYLIGLVWNTSEYRYAGITRCVVSQLSHSIVARDVY